MKTIVIFRKWKQSTYGDGVIALFPEIPDNLRGDCSSYEHVGQHGCANYANVISRTRQATPTEYQQLQDELTAIGYDLDVRSRATAAMRKKRMERL